jgi:TRAP-type C4-dicarboxylate transport system substrate-binding protein
MRRLRSAVIALLLPLALMAAAGPAHAGKTIVKLATLAPRGSAWYDILADMGAAWKEASGGQVQLKIYAGTLGDEADIMRRIRVGQIHAAAVTMAGLATVDEAAMAYAIPMGLETNGEVDYVRDHLSPKLEERLRERGFQVLNWGEAGWVNFFTKEPVHTPDDLKKLKVFVWSTGDPFDHLWKQQGYDAVPLSATDILPALQTGMISALPTTPIAALSNQWFPFTKYMTAIHWAPLPGATVISLDVWNKIPEDIRPRLMEIARETGDKMRQEIRRAEPEGSR